MTASRSQKRGRAALIIVLCVLALFLAAGGTLFALLNHKVKSLQAGASFSFSYQVQSTSAETPALYGVLEKVGATQGTVSGQYAPGKFQVALVSQRGNDFTHIYIDSNETLYDAGQLYTYLRGQIVDAAPLASLVLPSWSMGSYISQTQLASVLGTELSAVEMQDMTGFSLALGALQKVTPDGALDGYTYYEVPSSSDITLIFGLPMKELFAKTTPLHVLLTIPEHSVTISLSGTVTAAETAVVAPTSRMSDEEVDSFVQLRKSLESFAAVLQSALQGSNS